MICDSHVHVGKYYETYTSPERLIELTKALNLNRYAVSSTTICDENYSKVLNEIEYLIIHDALRVDPVLWVTPHLIKEDKKLNEFIISGIRWKCLKIHPELHPKVWNEDNSLFDDLISLAWDLKLPVLIHTGGYVYSMIHIWEEKLKLYPYQKFIFAHCRPFDQAVPILKKYPNAYGDLAFIDELDFPRLISENIWNKILWGSDIPINEYFFKNISTKEYYTQRMEILKEILTVEQLDTITFKNYHTLFKS